MYNFIDFKKKSLVQNDIFLVFGANFLQKFTSSTLTQFSFLLKILNSCFTILILQICSVVHNLFTKLSCGRKGAAHFGGKPPYYQNPTCTSFTLKPTLSFNLFRVSWPTLMFINISAMALPLMSL